MREAMTPTDSADTGAGEEIEKELREAAADRHRVAWSRTDGGQEWTLEAMMAERAADWIASSRAREAELRKALEQIKRMKSEPIGDTGFSVGPLALFQACQRIARDTLKRHRAALSPNAKEG